MATSCLDRLTCPAQDAVAALNTLQSNFAVIDAIRKSGRGMNKNAIPEMIDWCRRAGHDVSLPAGPARLARRAANKRGRRAFRLVPADV